MRIGIFTDTYPPFINGVSTSIVMLERALIKAGHDVYVVTVNNEKMAYRYENEDRMIRLPGIPTGIYDYRLTGIYPLKAVNQIKKWKLDIIHSHTEFGVGTFARILASQLKIPLVHTYHTMWEDYVHYITKGYFDGTSKKVVEYLTKFYCDVTTSELVVPTKKTYDLFKEKYKVERSVHIVPTGIEVERFYKENKKESELKILRESLGLQKEDYVILFVGRIAKEKSIDFLIENHKSIIKKHPHCKLLIVGNGPDMEKLKKLVIKNKLEQHVVFTGKVPWEDVPKYYWLSSCFATASDSETQGLTVIEAHAASLPVVALADESFKLVVTDELNGYLFKNKRQYVKSVITLIEDAKLARKFTIQARNNAEQHSSKHFATKMIDVYTIALQRFTEKREKKGMIGKMKDKIGGVFGGKK